MDFTFDLNALFPERVSVLDNNLTAGRKAPGRPDPQIQIATVIDELGKASAKAQQLPAPITSAAKLQANRHHLYLLKDGEQNGGRAVVVGFLKVGCKKLFLLDQQGAHVETEPLCVLDFYIKETLQRHGYGLELFDFMLKHKQVEPGQMAYDRPSAKFLSFLDKHYDLKNSVPQVNNFVVFSGFFKSRSAAQLRKVPPKKPEGEIKPYSLMERDVVRKEQRSLPLPFVRPAAPPPSPPLLLSSPQSRSLSVGSSPSHGPLRPTALPGLQPRPSLSSQLNENCREKRTRPHPQGQVVFLPALTASKKDHQQEQTSVDPERREELHSDQKTKPTDCLGRGTERRSRAGEENWRKDGRSEMERGGGRGGWSWTVGESRCNAQWVRQKQEYRSTRPW
ncbi:alpha-tubulin N-acetyltransferase 1 isoform X4 [Triplophysa dalaica]|uniref:alpha-tubulin N-acetyltransferase 1 isoform X4 n=1 Tax=Triplophysa dalaica TaxID=1582913 RepID=UPI0024DFA5D9|nr:alpha-tubulin N-acetyltransferase 1 isoform X4 [Triplophysa dalaica]